MHESAVRLHQAAAAVGVEGSSAIASRLDETPQTVYNWERRGVSAEGAIKASVVFNCSAAWLRSGTDVARRNTHASGVHATSAHETRAQYLAPPPLAAALPVVLDALEACPHTAELERLLPLLPTGAPAYRERLAQLLGVEVAHAPAVAPTAPAMAPAPPRPDLARHRSQAGTPGFKPPPVPGGPARTPSAAGPAESSAGSAPVPRPAE